MSESDGQQPEDHRVKQEERLMGGIPHVEGITRGTVLEYDDWQWALVSEMALNNEPPKLGFILLNNIPDDDIAGLESAWGCHEHFVAVKPYRHSEHEYWADVDYVVKDEKWQVLGPTHPETHDGKEVATDGGKPEDYQPDRWKCPDCGKVYIDPPTVIVQCGCGSDRIQLRTWPRAGDDWEAPEWPEDSDYSPDPSDIEGGINDMESRFDPVNGT